MPINLDEFLIEVVDDMMPSLVMGSATIVGRTKIGVCCGYNGVCFTTASGTIGVSFFLCSALNASLPIASSTISIDLEDFLRKASRWG